MVYKDLREWLKEVEQLRQLKKINGAKWDLEMGAITELIYHEGRGTPPAILFDHVPGYPQGFRTLFGATCSPERMALTLGFPASIKTGVDLVKTYRDELKKFKPIPPKTVNDGPIFENQDKGINQNSKGVFVYKNVSICFSEKHSFVANAWKRMNGYNYAKPDSYYF